MTVNVLKCEIMYKSAAYFLYNRTKILFISINVLKSYWHHSTYVL